MRIYNNGYNLPIACNLGTVSHSRVLQLLSEPAGHPTSYLTGTSGRRVSPHWGELPSIGKSGGDSEKPVHNMQAPLSLLVLAPFLALLLLLLTFVCAFPSYDACAPSLFLVLSVASGMPVQSKTNMK